MSRYRLYPDAAQGASTPRVVRVLPVRVEYGRRAAWLTVETPGRNVRAKAGLNRSIMAGGWGLFATRLQDKAPGRVEKVNPAYT